jgi:hypothetical protein
LEPDQPVEALNWALQSVNRDRLRVSDADVVSRSVWAGRGKSRRREGDGRD